MNLDKYTRKAQTAILEAQRLAQELNLAAVEPAHVLLALIRLGENRSFLASLSIAPFPC